MDNPEVGNDLHLDVAICPHLPFDHIEEVVAAAANSAQSFYSRFGISGGRWRARRLQGACIGSVALRRNRSDDTRPSFVIVIACDQGLARSDLERAASQASKDPFAVSVFRISRQALEDPKSQAAISQSLWASVWKAWLYPGARPDNIRTSISLGDTSTSRRSFLTLSYKNFVPCPTITQGSCASGAGCRICVDKCPANALFVGEQMRIELDRKACTSCGICVTNCPKEAARMPGASLSELWASLFGAAYAQHALNVKLGDSSAVPEGFIWTCSQADAGGSPWVVARARCIADLPSFLLLAPLTMGLRRVAISHCGSGCLSGQIEEVKTKVEFSRLLLEALGSDPDAVKLFTNGSIPQSATCPLPQSEAGIRSLKKDHFSGSLAGDRPSWFLYTERSDWAATGLSEEEGRWYPKASDVILQLVRILSRGQRASTEEDGHFLEKIGGKVSSAFAASRLPKAIIHEGSPLGIVEIDREACTLCGTCASSCPADALGLDTGAGEGNGEKMDQTVMLSVDYTACIACGNCVSSCPEREAGAIRVHQGIDFELLELGRRVVNESRIHRCPRCGNAVASSKVFERIAAILGGEFSGRMLLCEECKGVF